MKRLVPILAIVLLALAACQQPTTTPPAATTPTTPPASTYGIHVYDSRWVQHAPADVIAAAKTSRAIGARDAVDITALQSAVAAYNSATPDDHLTVIEGDEVPIEESPLANIWIVNRVTHDIIESYLDWPRADYVARCDIFHEEASQRGGELYVDNIPPAPIIVPDTRPDYEKYALYLVAADGSIVYEEHCADTWGGVGSDWPTVEAWYLARRQAYELEAYGNGLGEYVVSGQLYTPPSG